LGHSFDLGSYRLIFCFFFFSIWVDGVMTESFVVVTE
jgi:hypothetical protein